MIHLIVTVLSDNPSFEWECNVTGQPIWFRPLKLTFSTCFFVVVAQQWHGAMLSGGLAKGQWAVLGMVTEGGDWVVLTSHFYRSHKGSWKKSQLLYVGCVSFTVDWLFWNIYSSSIAPRPLLSSKSQEISVLTIWDLWRRPKGVWFWLAWLSHWNHAF